MRSWNTYISCHQFIYTFWFVIKVVIRLFINYFNWIIFVLFLGAHFTKYAYEKVQQELFFSKFCRWKLSTIEDDRWSSGERVSWCIYNPAELTSSPYYCCPYTRLLLTERTSNKIRCDDIIAAETSKTRWAWGTVMTKKVETMISISRNRIIVPFQTSTTPWKVRINQSIMKNQPIHVSLSNNPFFRIN